MYNYTALFLNFTLEQYVVMESEGYVPVGVMLSGGRSTTPITVIVTPTEQSPISAMGKYVRIYIRYRSEVTSHSLTKICQVNIITRSSFVC